QARIEDEQSEEGLAGVVKTGIGEPEILRRRVRRRARSQERASDRGEEGGERARAFRGKEAEADLVGRIDRHGAGAERLLRPVIVVDADAPPGTEVAAQPGRPAPAG